ncbi:MAG: envelope stress response membrane protein PspB [Pseudomonadota bacterium]
MSEFTFVLAILFLTIVVPLAIILHFITKWKASRELTRSDETLIEEVWEIAQKLETRVQVLEEILDMEAPDWRTKQ